MSERLRKQALAMLNGRTDATFVADEVALLRAAIVGNAYDHTDRVRREGVILAGPLKLASYRVRDPDTGELSPTQFHMTYDNMVLAVMGEEAAKLFARFVCGHLGIEFGERVAADAPMDGR